MTIANPTGRPAHIAALDPVRRVLSAVIRGVAVAAGLSVFLMMVQVALDVALRAVFGTGIPGTLTIVSYYYMVIVAFVPLAFAELRRAHIQMELVTEMMSRPMARQVTGWQLLPVGLITGGLAWRGYEEAVKQMARGASQVQGLTTIETWPATFALPLGAGLMTLLVALRFVEFLLGADPLAPDEDQTREASQEDGVHHD
ncbi:TRAP transporter small permease [Chachezhania sediminis]|uniref:TRAP transporter small permease n=1 Tax=Chachezhania sediminis TaxID=2599291 RepID=UPI00131E949D|nr:TRAP transporter small permease [Chachezhania sediminis]